MKARRLVLYCQPTVGCDDGQIRSIETLVRWRRDSGTVVPACDWVPAIETSLLRDRFNLHVLALAVEHRERWARLGMSVPMSVNVTPSSLASPRFVAAVEELFADHPPAGLRLEITERTTAINSGALKANVERLAGLGFEFDLDDFGVGYSSLARLASLPVSTLKIDGSLVGDIAEDETHRAIVESVSHLGQSLGLDVVCEGVEDQATWTVLQGLGCDRIQGYHVARPMPAEDFPGFAERYVAAPPQLARCGAPDTKPRWTHARQPQGR